MVMCPFGEWVISIHAPAKGATQSGDHGSGGNAISIHAPAKGATENTFMVYDDSIISIHAPAKGATIYGKWGRVDLADFNPRSREGSDCPLDGPTLVGQISIHAPAKGATN